MIIKMIHKNVRLDIILQFSQCDNDNEDVNSGVLKLMHQTKQDMHNIKSRRVPAQPSACNYFVNTFFC